MRVVVFGGSGFLGSHIADALSDAGHDVVVFDKVPSRYLRPDQTMLVGDVLDAASVRRALAGCRVVYNLAAIADLDDCLDQPAATVSVNILGNVNILEACVQEGIERFVYASSIYVNSQKGGFYRCSKQAAECYVEEYGRKYGLTYSILRYGTLYGPRADKHNSVYRYLRQALTEKRIVAGSTGDEQREYIYITDAARSSVEILQPQYANLRINITGHQQIRFGDFLNIIREMLDNKVEITLTQQCNAWHYTCTPYSYRPNECYKFTSNLFIDIGQGLLTCLQAIERERQAEAAGDATSVSTDEAPHVR